MQCDVEGYGRRWQSPQEIKSSLHVRLLEELEEDQKKSVMVWLAETLMMKI